MAETRRNPRQSSSPPSPGRGWPPTGDNMVDAKDRTGMRKAEPHSRGAHEPLEGTEKGCAHVIRDGGARSSGNREESVTDFPACVRQALESRSSPGRAGEGTCSRPSGGVWQGVGRTAAGGQAGPSRSLCSPHRRRGESQGLLDSTVTDQTYVPPPLQRIGWRGHCPGHVGAREPRLPRRSAKQQPWWL